jgi:hypothetical protein
VRLKGPGSLARITTSLDSRFAFYGTCSRKFGMRWLQRSLRVRIVVCVLSAAIPSPSLAHAQSRTTEIVRFYKGIQWGDTALPPGDYVITSLYVKNAGAVLTFSAPSSQPPSANPGTRDAGRRDAVSTDAPPEDGSLFTIHSVRNQTAPYGEAQTIYLSACRVVEQEFNRTEAIRPQLTLLLGSDGDRLYYPKREIQLRKWDKYKFAEGVVMLAVEGLLPQEKKSSLSNLAVLTADSTVDVSELKRSRTPLRARPRN